MAPATTLHSARIDARFISVLHMLLTASKRCYQHNKAADKFRNCLGIEPQVFRVPLEPRICNLRATFFKLDPTWTFSDRLDFDELPAALARGCPEVAPVPVGHAVVAANGVAGPVARDGAAEHLA